jgi:hypothetical protein
MDYIPRWDILSTISTSTAATVILNAKQKDRIQAINLFN